MPHPIIPVSDPGWRPLMNTGGGMRQTLPGGDDWAIFTYGGVNFGPFTKIESYDVEVRYDERMNRSYNQFTLACVSTVTGSSAPSADALCTQIRWILTQPKLPLHLSGRAVGEMRVNVAGIVDIRNGPIPTVQSFELKGTVTAVFRWTLSWCLPDCNDAVYTADMGVLSNTYTVSTTVDGGYTSRNISGKVVIPQNSFALGARFPANAADKFMKVADGRPGSIFPELPPYFRRGPYTYTLSPDRSELAYSITDTQTGYQAPPPGCITADELYEAHSDSKMLFQWSATVSGRYEIPYNGNPNDAVNAFFSFAVGKLDYIVNMQKQQKDANGNPVANRPNGLIPTAFSLGEPEVRGKRIVALSLTVYFVSGLKNVIEQSGMWRQVNNGQWQAWFDTMGFVFNPLGTARLDFGFNRDVYVDLCQPNTGNLGQYAPGLGNLRNLRPANVPLVPQTQELRNKLKPQLGNNWLYYRAWVQPVHDAGTNSVVTSPTEPLGGKTDLTGTFNGLIASAVNGVIAGGAELIGGSLIGSLVPPAVTPLGQGVASGNANGVPGVPTNQAVGITNNLPTGTTWIERRVRPQVYFYFCGNAARYGEEVPPPFLTFVTIKGEKYPVIDLQREEDGPFFWQNTVSTPSIAGGTPYPVYCATWRRRYGVVGPVPGGPFTIDLPPNPFTGQ